MKLAAFFGVYEAEKAFAGQTLSQLLEILREHELHLLILDDASPSHVGQNLLDSVAAREGLTTELIRLEQSSGFRGAMDRTLLAFRHLAAKPELYDYVLRIDADLFINRADLAQIFAHPQLPKFGMIGPLTRFRLRDYVQVLADILPFGFRRRQRTGVVEHKWELSRFKPVWWADLGLKALFNGFSMNFIGGPFQLIAGASLKAMYEKGWLSRAPLRSLGLVFGEDVMTNILIRALAHPLHDISQLFDDWQCDMALKFRDTAAAHLLVKKYYLLHPLKGDAQALQLRYELAAQRPRDNQ